MKIGNIEIKANTVLAPMAGVNCTSFRLLCRKYGAGLLFTQMYDVEAVVEKDKKGKLKEFLNIRKEESPIALQLIGKVNDRWAEAVKIAEKYADIIDINLGCTEPDYLGNKSGCYLMQHPDQVRKIVRACVGAADKPVTAKIRSGWDNKSINAVEIAKILESEGVAAITVHPRTRKQRYMDKADWNVIRQVKEAVSVPVIGNGDITLTGHAKAMIEQTKCDAVMIGREARKNPKIFDEINYLLENGRNKDDCDYPVREMIKEFIVMYNKYEKRDSVNEVKDHCMWLLSGVKGATQFKQRIKDASSVDKIIKLIKDRF